MVEGQRSLHHVGFFGLLLTGVNRKNRLPGLLDNCTWRREKAQGWMIGKPAAEVEEEGVLAFLFVTRATTAVHVCVFFFFFFF